MKRLLLVLVMIAGLVGFTWLSTAAQADSVTYTGNANYLSGEGNFTLTLSAGVKPVTGDTISSVQLVLNGYNFDGIDYASIASQSAADSSSVAGTVSNGNSVLTFSSSTDPALITEFTNLLTTSGVGAVTAYVDLDCWITSGTLTVNYSVPEPSSLLLLGSCLLCLAALTQRKRITG